MWALLMMRMSLCAGSLSYRNPTLGQATIPSYQKALSSRRDSRKRRTPIRVTSNVIYSLEDRPLLHDFGPAVRLPGYSCRKSSGIPRGMFHSCTPCPFRRHIIGSRPRIPFAMGFAPRGKSLPESDCLEDKIFFVSLHQTPQFSSVAGLSHISTMHS